MVDAVHDLHLWKIKRANTLDTGNVDAELDGVRAPLMMGVDAANFAEIVLRRASMEFIER